MKNDPVGEGGNDTKKIAVIEEIANDIYSVKFVLQSVGYRVRSFSSRNVYQDELDGFAPQLIIVDMMIPDGKAYQIMKELGAGRQKRIPVLAITAEAMEGEEQDVYSAGGADVLSKPYSVSDLQKKLRKWLP